MSDSVVDFIMKPREAETCRVEPREEEYGKEEESRGVEYRREEPREVDVSRVDLRKVDARREENHEAAADDSCDHCPIDCTDVQYGPYRSPLRSGVDDLNCIDVNRCDVNVTHNTDFDSCPSQCEKRGEPDPTGGVLPRGLTSRGEFPWKVPAQGGC